MNSEATEAVEILARRGMWDDVGRLATAMCVVDLARRAWNTTSGVTPERELRRLERERKEAEASARALIDAVI